jgi:ABC-type glucose/galactose transport system permease subunit
VNPRARRRLVVATGIAGLVLMIGFDRPLTRVLGVLSLFAFVVAGLFLVADREFLEVVEPDAEPS